MKVYLESVGNCRNRRLDAAKLKDFFIRNGFSAAKNPQSADYILLLTCAFRREEEDFSIAKIKKFNTFRGELIVGGCLRDINGEKLRGCFNGKTFSPKENGTVDSFFSDFSLKLSELPDANYIQYKESLLASSAKGLNYFRKNILYANPLCLCGDAINLRFKMMKTRRCFFIRISDGCNERCSFCGSRLAIGKLRSKPQEECLREFRSALSQNYRDFMLVAKDVGSYGVDIGLTLPDLLYRMLEIGGDRLSIYLEDLNPKWVVTYLSSLVDIVKRGSIPLIISPLQSGSERILKLMNREIDIDMLVEAYNKLKQASGMLQISTAIIVGFPSETAEDVWLTIDMLKRICPVEVKIFAFSQRPNMAANLITPKIPQEEIFNRIKTITRESRKAGIRFDVL